MAHLPQDRTVMGSFPVTSRNTLLVIVVLAFGGMIQMETSLIKDINYGYKHRHLPSAAMIKYAVMRVW